MSRNATTTYITLTGTILADTGKAIRMQIAKMSGENLSASRTEWVPVSQISKMFKDPNETGADWIMVAEWLVNKLELA